MSGTGNSEGRPVDPKEVLSSWKEIAAHLRCSERTVRRWEEEGLPVRRHPHKKKSGIYAYRVEVDAWWNDGHARLEAIEKERSSQRLEANQKSGWDRRWKLAGTILLAIVVILIVAAVTLDRSTEAPIKSIAVAPFASKDSTSNSDLGDDITAGLIDSLSKIPNLRVMSRSSVSRYKGRVIDPATIGRDLHVETILTGTLTPDGNGFVLDAELVRTSDSSHLWGGHYATQSDVLALQSEMAGAISDRLRPHLSADTKSRLANPGTSNPQAHDLYIKGRYAADFWDPRNWTKALSYFQQAIEKDPAYPQAYAGVGEAYALLTHFRSVPPDEGIPKAKAAAHKALQLDPNLAEAHCAMGAADYMAWQWQESEEETRRCVELNPNLSIAHAYRSYSLASLGKMDQAIAENQRALELDPVSFSNNFYAADNYYYSRDYDRAIEKLLTMIQIEPNQSVLHNALADSYAMKDEFDHAADEYEKALRLDGKDLQAAALRRAYAKDGFRGLLRAQIQFWSHPQESGDYCPDSIAENYSRLGDKERAFTWLDRAYTDNDKTTCEGNLVDIKVHPYYDTIRPDPRFQAFLHRMRFP